MIGMCLAARGKREWNKLPHAIACVCVLLWIVGSFSTLYGDLAPHSRTPHCPPQSHANATHSCAWHCDGVESSSSSGRSCGPSIAPTGFVSRHPSPISYATNLNRGITTRGPPHFMFVKSV